jgi:hypothetical protein
MTPQAGPGATLAEMLASLRAGGLSGPPGFGWATVDVDRTIRDLADAYPDSVWQDAEEPLLGAVGRRITFGASTAVVLEPSTEGLLAGWLARNGEGEAVAYVDGGLEARPPEQVMTGTGRTGWLERPVTPRARFVIRLDQGEQ